MYTTPSTWFLRGSLLLASTALIGSLASADPNGLESEPAVLKSSKPLTAPDDADSSGYDSLKDALKGGRFWMNFRSRYENVNWDAKPQQGRGMTLRTRLGYETGKYKHWAGVIEFSDTAAIGGVDYNDTLNGKTDRPVIADPASSMVNEVYAKYTNLWDSTIKIGRQRVNFDNQRFIGSVAWRQNEQTLDAISFAKTDLAGVNVVYAYIDHINRIFGPNSPKGNLDSNSHVLNMSKSWDDVGKLVGYGYYIDTPSLTTINTFTYGLRFDGGHDFDKWTMLYTAELAHQNDVASNPQDVSAGYLNAMFGGRIGKFTLKAGYEVLDGALDAGSNPFSTPLSTAHAHNGWADQFITANGLNNVAGGIEDMTLSVGYKFGKTSLKAIYHDFSPERGAGSDYGTEINLLAVHKFDNGIDLGLKYADFNANAGGGYVDKQVAWAWLYYSF